MNKSPRQDAQTILLYIDSYRMDIPEGRLYCPGTGETDTFRGLMQMLVKIEESMDVRNTPQSFHTIRRFSRFLPLWPPAPEETGTKPGRSGTFHLQFLFRRNASWQGSVTWLEEDRCIHFRSALELIFLLSSALSGFPGDEWTEENVCLEG